MTGNEGWVGRWLKEKWFQLTACPMCKARRDALIFGSGAVYISPDKFFKGRKGAGKG